MTLERTGRTQIGRKLFIRGFTSFSNRGSFLCFRADCSADLFIEQFIVNENVLRILLVSSMMRELEISSNP